MTFSKWLRITLSASLVIQALAAQAALPARRAPKGDDSVTVTNAENLKLERELRKFLMNLGFKDFSARIRKSLAEKKYLNAISKSTLEDNLQRYELVNHARELAIFILTRGLPYLENEAFREKYLRFSAKLLKLKPLAPPLTNHEEVIPSEVKKQGRQAVDKYLENLARDKMKLQASKLAADYINSFYQPSEIALLEQLSQAPSSDPTAGAVMGEVKKAVDDLAGYIKRVYLDPQVGETQWLGRAMALGIARHAKLTGDARLMGQFRQITYEEGLHLPNFIGSEVLLNGGVNNRRIVRVRTGDLAYERSRGAVETAVITAAAVPKDFDEAKKQGLVGAFLGALYEVTDEDLENGYDPQEIRKLMKAQDARFSKGMSHVGQWVVYKDEATGIEHTLIFDNYPYSVEVKSEEAIKWGGVRVNGLEHFANPGEVMRVGVAKYDEQKLFEYAKRTTADRVAKYRGSSKWWDWSDHSIWPAYEPELVNGHIVARSNPKRRDWRLAISPQEFVALHTIADRDQWIKEWRRRITAGWETMMADWGVWFNWVDTGAGYDQNGKFQPGKYWFGGMYCSQTVDSVSNIFTGLTLEEDIGGFRPAIHRAQKVVNFLRAVNAKFSRDGSKALDETTFPVIALDLRERILAPSSLAMQKFVETDRFGKRVVEVLMPQSTLGQQAELFFSPSPTFDAATLNVLNRIPKIDEYLSPLLTFKIDPAEQEALVIRWRKYLLRRGADFRKTPAEIFGK